jgi:hypothetical protein
MYLQELFVDIRSIQSDIEVTKDPALIFEYEEEQELLFDELEAHAQDAIFILEAYFQDCKEQNIPVMIEYYRVYRELSNARRLKLLPLE